MNDAALADEIINRLNTLITHPDICEDINRLIEVRVTCSEATADHPTIQVRSGEKPAIGFLGLLNGIVGAVQEGKLAGHGFIAAEVGDDGKLVRFLRTDE